jgi:NTP pyrophosphatase (non-canonical NTP hydrolase)
MLDSLNKWRNFAYDCAVSKGFYSDSRAFNLGESLMLIVSELGEIIEAERTGNIAYETLKPDVTLDSYNVGTTKYKDCFEAEFADVFLRLFSLAGRYGIDLDYWVAKKYEYNQDRPYLHDKKYG